jgi:hypothetical protein
MSAEGTADSGIATSKAIWLQGFAQTGALGTEISPVTYLFFDTSPGPNWRVRMGIVNPGGPTYNIDYIVSYYSK